MKKPREFLTFIYGEFLEYRGDDYSQGFSDLHLNTIHKSDTLITDIFSNIFDIYRQGHSATNPTVGKRTIPKKRKVWRSL